MATHEASQCGTHLVSCRGKPTEQHCDNSMNVWVVGQFKVSTSTRQWVFGQVGGGQLGPVRCRAHISGDGANSAQKGRRTQAFMLRSEHTNRGDTALPFCTGDGILSLSKTFKVVCRQLTSLQPEPSLSCQQSRSLLVKTQLKRQTWTQVSEKNVN